MGALILALLACRCAEPVEAPPPARPPPHFDEWDRLVAVAARGDVATAKIVARDLSDGGADGDEGTAELGGALGFLQLATDREELADGVAKAAAGCGACHVARAVPAPPLPAWAHETAAHRAAASLVWGDPTGPVAGDDPVMATIVDAWTADTPEARVAAVLLACQGCHAEDARADEPPTDGRSGDAPGL